MDMETVKTIYDVEAEIRKAVLILKSLPKEGPKKVSSSWPEFKPDLSIDIQIPDSKRITPYKEEIDDMNMVFENWFKVLDYNTRNLVFYKNSGWRWKTLAHSFGLSRNSLYSRYKKALSKILLHVRQHDNIPLTFM